MGERGQIRLHKKFENAPAPVIRDEGSSKDLFVEGGEAPEGSLAWGLGCRAQSLGLAELRNSGSSIKMKRIQER